MTRPGISSSELDPQIVRKLDAGLQYLLRLTDDQIRAAKAADNARLGQALKQIQALAKALPPRATPKDRRAMEQKQARLRARLKPDLFHGTLIVSKAKRKPVQLRALVEFAGNRDDLVAMGLEVWFQAQDIFAVVGTRAQMATLAAQPGTLRMALPRPMLPTVEQACEQAQIDKVHTGQAAQPIGFKGKGVIVGIIDRALDVTHHAFCDAAPPHGSRVLYYWLQRPDDPSAWGKTPAQCDPDFAGLERGRLYSHTDIDKAMGLPGGAYGTGANQIARNPASEPHGTQVAGAAVGNGLGLDWNNSTPHVGAAPEADLVFVGYEFDQHNSSGDAAFEDDVLAGLDFIFKVADKQHVPAVVNVSLGSALGPHNGSAMFDLARDNLINSYRERCIVWSVGNGNDTGGHLQGAVPSGATEVLTLDVHPETGPATYVELWYSGPALEFQVENQVENQISKKKEVAQTQWCPANQGYTHNLGFLNLHEVDVYRDAESAPGLRNLRFQIKPPDTTKYPEHKVPLTIRLRNPDPTISVFYDAWVGFLPPDGKLGGAKPGYLTLSDTGCARSLLTVGACAKNPPFKKDVGEPITPYSGAGPTLDGRIKPEIVAVGGDESGLIMSAQPDGASGYGGIAGTSFAAPIVAGAIALVFDEFHNTLKRALRNETVKALLTQTANRSGLSINPLDPGYKAEDRNRYGYGRLRLLDLVDQNAPAPDVDVWIRTAADDYGLEPYPGDVFWLSPDIIVRIPGTTIQVDKVRWDKDDYAVIVCSRNLGHSPAVGTILKLYYALPGTAQQDWALVTDKAGNVRSKDFTIPPLNKFVVTFPWQPKKADFPDHTGETHFCLLAVLDHPLDRPQYLEDPSPNQAGDDPFMRNVKGDNNIAQHNIIITD